MTHKDQVTRLLGALKSEHRNAVHGVSPASADFHDGTAIGCTVCQLIAQTEAELAAESSQDVEIMCNGELHYRRPINDPMVMEALRTPGYSVRHPWTIEAPPNPSPINACIRAAKRVIAALNLPESGVYWNGDIWCFSSAKPKPDDNGGWEFYGVPVYHFALPDTAIPPWPGDFRESWITADTPEVEL